MGRRELRENIFKLLFRVEFYETDELPEQLITFFDMAAEMIESDEIYIKQKFNAMLEKLPEIDLAINKISEGWKTSRMCKVDLTLIRLAVYEIQYDQEVPTSVAINEAVELAKKYGTDESPSFVNGVLAKLA
ncbi:MAG: transcription antitermination factor NusB [Lachnospiraceae bacterium]